MINRYLCVILLLLASCFGVSAQQSGASTTEETPKFEVGVHFTALNFTRGSGNNGVGGRFTFNLNRNVALEAEGNFFPAGISSIVSSDNRAQGRAAQGLFGVKAGKRYEKFGVFAKARPGFSRFSEGRRNVSLPSPNTPLFRTESATHLTTDVGGVLEFYPKKRLVTRFDFGDTIIRYGKQTVNFLTLLPDGTFRLQPFGIGSRVQHNFQFSAGLGWRF